MSGVHLSTAFRLIAVRLVDEEKMSYERVAHVLRCHKSTISRLTHRFRTTGEIEEVHSGGRPRLYDATQMQQLEQLIEQLIEQHRNRTAMGLQHILPSSTPHVSDRTLRRYRRELDFTARHQHLTSRRSGRYDRQRWLWAWEHRRDPASKWLHSDECTVRMQQTGDIVRVKRGQPTPPMEVTTLRCHVNVWGVVWDHGSIFVQFDGHLPSDAFIELLKAHLLPEKENLAGRVLLIDQHPAHRSKSAKAWLTPQGFNHVMLPTHSPQFNGIEECWSWMKRYVRHLTPKTEAELMLAVREAGELLPSEVINAHLDHAQSSIRTYAFREEGEGTTYNNRCSSTPGDC